MAPGPVRWPWIASSVPSETFFAGVRFRGWMSEAEGFLCSRLPASLTWPARPGSMPLTQPRPHDLCPGHGPDAAPPASAAGVPPAGIPPLSPICSRLLCLPDRSRAPASRTPALARAAGRRSLHHAVPRLPARPLVLGRAGPRLRRPPSRPRAPAPIPAPADPAPRLRCPAGRLPVSRPRRSGQRAVWRRPGPLAGSWQRIDGVSRLLPYSDLLTLTSSSRRGEGLSDRGSWKRMRILLTGHVEHESLISKRARSLSGLVVP